MGSYSIVYSGVLLMQQNEKSPSTNDGAMNHPHSHVHVCVRGQLGI